MWYNKVVSNLGEIPGFIDYYERELVAAKADIKINGKVAQGLGFTGTAMGSSKTPFTRSNDMMAELEEAGLSVVSVIHQFQPRRFACANLDLIKRF